MTEPTKISIRVAAHINLGDFEWFEESIQIDDQQRDGVDANSGAAIDRIHKLAEAKLAEKIETYRDK